MGINNKRRVRPETLNMDIYGLNLITIGKHGNRSNPN